MNGEGVRCEGVSVRGWGGGSVGVWVASLAVRGVRTVVAAGNCRHSFHQLLLQLPPLKGRESN